MENNNLSIISIKDIHLRVGYRPNMCNLPFDYAIEKLYSIGVYQLVKQLHNSSACPYCGENQFTKKKTHYYCCIYRENNSIVNCDLYYFDNVDNREKIQNIKFCLNCNTFYIIENKNFFVIESFVYTTTRKIVLKELKEEFDEELIKHEGIPRFTYSINILNELIINKIFRGVTLINYKSSKKIIINNIDKLVYEGYFFFGEL